MNLKEDSLYSLEKHLIDTCLKWAIHNYEEGRQSEMNDEQWKITIWFMRFAIKVLYRVAIALAKPFSIDDDTIEKLQNEGKQFLEDTRKWL